jgi:hypothetical protein
MMLPCRPGGRTFAASNFHIEASHFRTKVMVIRTVDQMHAITISDDRVSERLDFERDTCLMDERVRTGIHIVQTVAAIFP